MSLSRKYAKSKDEKWAVRFRTSHPDEETRDGVVTHIARSFIVLRETCDFDFDGVLVLPKRVVTGYRDGKCERCHNRILRFNGNIRKARTPRWLGSCNSVPEVLKQIKKRGIWPCIGIVFELDGKTETDFFIGRIVRFEDDRFWILDYDAAGNWGEEYDIEFREILSVGFNDRYSTEFNKYMKSL